MFGVCQSNDSVLISELDYKFIGDCSDGNKLEDILKVLRSGEEGVYPDLIHFTEKRLGEIKPTSLLLCSSNDKDYPMAKTAYADESKSINKDLEDWQNEMKSTEAALKSAKPIQNQIPPIRQTGNKTHNATAENSQNTDKQSQNISEGLPPKEYDTLALAEKLKGNDAFRSEDFAEALNYYNRSLSIAPQMAVFNNRAAVFLKLKRYKEAINDCEIVLKSEPRNIKAMLRMAVAEEATGKYKEAISTLQKLLDIEPSNKRAKELLDNLKKSTSGNNKSEPKSENNKQRGRKLKIEEIDSSTEQKSLQPKNAETISNNHSNVIHDNKSDSKAAPTKNDNKTANGKRLNVTEVESMSDVKAKEESIDCNRQTNEQPVPVIEFHDLPIQVLRLKDKGNELYRTGKYAEAATTYADALNKLKSNISESYRPSDIAVLHSNRAAALQRTGKSKEAITDATCAIQLFPTAKALSRRATAYEAIEKYSHSYVDHRSALSIDPSLLASQQALSRLGTYLRQQHGSSWRDQLPQNEVNHTGNQFVLPTKPVNYQSNTKTVNQMQTKECQKVDPDVQYNELKKKGNSLVTQGKYKEAIHMYSECVKLRKTETSALTNRALCYIKINLPLKAIDDCSEALVIEPTNVKALYRCALAKKMTKSYKSSLVDLRKLLDIEQNNSAAKTLFENVKSLYREELLASKSNTNKKK